MTRVLECRSVLPPGLDPKAVCPCVRYVQNHLTDFPPVVYRKPKLLNAIVRILGKRALARYSEYETIHPTQSALRMFLGLRHCGAGNNPSPNESLESKASKRPWAIQSHYDHPGWYIVWRYLVDDTQSLEAGRPVIIWRVDVVFLEKRDWKYEKSRAGDAGGGRTHTFGVKNPAQKLKHAAVYRRRDVAIKDGKPVPANGGQD